MKRHRQLERTAAMLLAASLIGAPAFAETLVSQVSFAIVETGEDGAETRTERKLVRPGETIEYALSHVNETEAGLSDLTVVGPVPEGVTLIMGSETSSLPALFEVQAEMEPETPGLEWSALPAFRRVVAEDGTETLEPVPAEAIAAVRWRLEGTLETGAVALNTYRVVVE